MSFLFEIYRFFIDTYSQIPTDHNCIYVTHNKKLSLFADEIYNFKNKKLFLIDE